MRKATKTIISFAVVLIAGLNIIVPALAQDPFTSIAIGGFGGASGAGLFGSMASVSGINIDYVSDPVNDAMWNKLNSDSVYFTGEKHEATGTGEDVWDYITVDIGDWLNAQSEFIVEFAQHYNVTDNSSGSTEGVLYFDGIPFPNTSPNRAVLATGPRQSYISAGQFACDISSDWKYTFYYNGIEVNTVSGTRPSAQEVMLTLRCDSPNNSVTMEIISGTTRKAQSSVIGTASQSGGISWTSRNVNTNIFNDWDSAKVKIPHGISQLSTGWTIPDFMQELDRIWYGAGEDNILIEDGENPPVPPVPPTPIPTTPLGEVPFDDWVDLWGQSIYEQLENQSDALDFIGANGTDAIEELESIDDNIGVLEETAESIDTNIGIGNGILGGIRTLAQSAVDYLESIAEHVAELVNEIVLGTETLISGILNQIPVVFGVIFGPIKQASSIWHYVVEWIQSISVPMTWIWSMAAGTSYNIILPVYASLAGAVVLAFYKRFGK